MTDNDFTLGDMITHIDVFRDTANAKPKMNIAERRLYLQPLFTNMQGCIEKIEREGLEALAQFYLKSIVQHIERADEKKDGRAFNFFSNMYLDAMMFLIKDWREDGSKKETD